MENNYILNNGVKMPSIIMGTTSFTSFRQMDEAICSAIDAGCRAFDTSRFYRTGGEETEKYLGLIIKGYLKAHSGLTREDFFITTKLAIPQLIRGSIEKDVLESINKLDTEYIDCLLIHWPFPDFFVPAYKIMEKLYKKGLVKSIGMSNCQIRHFEQLFNAGLEINPQVHQLELHPLNTASATVEYCKMKSINIQAYSPLGKMLDPIINNETLKEIAIKHDKSLAQIILRWHYQLGYAPIFRSKSVDRIKSNLELFDFKLEDDQIELISNLNQNYKICTESSRCPGY